MINHTDMQKLLSAYCGGDLDPTERVRVEKHLSECASCRAELADLQTALRLVRTTPEAEPPAWLATRVMARVREEQEQKRSWLQRIFFPLHIKLPIEVAALLMVCVTGYYLSRTVETELQQPAGRQELPAAPTESAKPVKTPQQESPAALPTAPALPRPAEKPAPPPKTETPAAPAAPSAADQVTMQPIPAAPGKASPRPAFAPAPPAVKQERSAPAAEEPAGLSQPFQPVPDGYAAKKAKKGAAPTNMDLCGTGAYKAASESLRGASDTATGTAVPAVRVRLTMTDPASAPGSLREAITRSGGSVIDNRPARPGIIKARIPSQRMNELLESLARLGTIAERPQVKDLAGIVEIEIAW